MLKFKKLIALTACAMLTTSVALTGCGADKTANAGEGETVKLTWYTIGQTPKDLDMVQEKANEYLKDKINATIDMKFIDYGDYTQKMGVIINSGEPYDLAFTCSWANPYLENARKGAFLEIDDLLESKGKEMKSVIDERFWEGAKIDGKTYAVPNQKEIGVAPMWVFTKEYVDKYNIPYQDIHTLEDLEPWLKVIHENEPDVTPLYITKGFSAPAYFDQLVDPVGVEYGDESLKIKNMFETDKMKSELETLQKYYDAGYINADSATAKDDKAVKRFVTKADGQPYAEGLWSKDLGYEVVASPIMDTHITNGSTTGSMIAISKTSEHPEKAMEFLNLLNTDVYLRNLLNYGIEGTHYEKTGDTQIKLTDKAKDYSVGYYTLGNLFITYTLDNEPVDKWKEFEAFNDASVESPALGFKFNTEKVSNQIAAINNVLEEFKSTIYSGSVNEAEYLDKMNKKLKEVGIDEVISEMQSQIDAWKAENGK
ncbi:extracellular solute-binding protein [Clostridium perfringens]|uniref:ABC transporter substrate-binding protein n=1 Tax=Clostridium perfringens TaxID=1502 RepID=UPI0007761176|nr:ABC transporter substrate-binding protein [Clostridium perfringens]AMN33574.1 ABC transporter substrate-binding protein [Clostridium perfringens]EJT5929525.1 ABC transporter substrate-binding protein [Clostridium perfringens]EJT6160790.1 ABC transporter substrate-binding protein [Clostridium perfringens]EJT6166666.1 ABC transporter substrate-binding protein [Clostridium perfringens]EJT6492425.1 ABC transporter substrate-binding protein [Clostridium perfringens]